MIENLELYRVFLCVATEKQFSAAAKTLCISQPAVSQAIKLLEEQLHCSLFVRMSKGVRLTAEGEVLFQHMQQAFSQMQHGERLVLQMRDMQYGEICIGASDMTLQFYLLPYLERFHMQYPNIKIRVTNAPTPETLSALEKGMIDFGVVSTPIACGPSIEVVNVKKIWDVFVAGTRFLSLKNRTISYKQLESYPLICLEATTSNRYFWDRFFEKRGLRLRPEFELATSDMIVQFALRNMGIGLVMRDFAQNYIEQGQLFEIMFDQKPPERYISLAMKKGSITSVATGHFLEMLKNDRI